MFRADSVSYVACLFASSQIITLDERYETMGTVCVSIGVEF